MVRVSQDLDRESVAERHEQLAAGRRDRTRGAGALDRAECRGLRPEPQPPPPHGREAEGARGRLGPSPEHRQGHWPRRVSVALTISVAVSCHSPAGPAAVGSEEVHPGVVLPVMVGMASEKPVGDTRRAAHHPKISVHWLCTPEPGTQPLGAAGYAAWGGRGPGPWEPSCAHTAPQRRVQPA